MTHMPETGAINKSTPEISLWFPGRLSRKSGTRFWRRLELEHCSIPSRHKLAGGMHVTEMMK